MFLVKPTLAGTNRTLQGVAATSNRFLFQKQGSNRWAIRYTEQGSAEAEVDVILGTTEQHEDWQVWAFVLDGSTYKLFIDGKLVGEETLTFTTLYTNVSPFNKLVTLGALNGETNWDGKLAKAAMWGVALTADEVAAYTIEMTQPYLSTTPNILADGNLGFYMGDSKFNGSWEDLNGGVVQGTVDSGVLLIEPQLKKANITIVSGSTYTVLETDEIIHVTASASTLCNITIPSALLTLGHTFTIKDAAGNAATNNITVSTGGSETIDGAASRVVSNNYESLTFYSDGNNWFIK